MRFLWLLFSCLVFTTAQAQLQFTVLNGSDGESLPGAHIALYDANEQLIQTVVTASEGTVTVVISDFEKYGALQAVCSYIGFEKDTLFIESNGAYSFELVPTEMVLNEMVVTGQYSPNSAEKSVHKIRVITREKIDGMQAVNLRDVLTNELNVRITQDGVLGSGMQLQGVSGQNVKIMMDGVPIIGRLDGNIDISQINLNDVERIEVVEGPLSVNYGTNALAGTINIITKKGSQNGTQAQVNAYAEQVGTFNLDANVSTSIKKHRLRFSAGRNYFDGWDPTENKAFNYFEQRKVNQRNVQWNPKEQYFGRLNWNTRSKAWELNAQAAHFEETITNRGEARQPLGTTAFDDTYVTQRSDASFSATRNGKKSRFHAVVGGNYFQRAKNTFVTDLTTQEQALSSDPSDQDTSIFRQVMSRGSYVYRFVPEKFSLELGYDFTVEDAVGERIENNTQQLGDYALFTTAEWKPTESLTLKPGMRIAHNTAYTAPVTPAINVLYRKKGWSFRGSFAQGFRAPDLKELYFFFVDINHNIQGNTDLRAEYSNNYSASASYQWIKKQTILRGEASGFLNQIEDRITLAQNNAQLFSYVNVGSFQTQGLTVKGSLLLQHLKIQVGANYIGRENIESEAFDVERFTYSPEVQSSLQYTWPKYQLKLSAFYKYTGELQGFAVVNDELVNTLIADFHTLDLTLGKSFWNDALSVSTGMKNVLNVQQIPTVGTGGGGAHSSSANGMMVGMGRVFFIQMRYTWKK